MLHRLLLPVAHRLAPAFLLVLALLVAFPGAAWAQTTLDRVDALLDTVPDIADDFSSNQDFWTTTYDGETSRYFKSGRLYIVVDVADTVAYSRADTTADDFFVEVDTLHIAGNVSNQLGIVFRFVDENNFYFFAIGNDGYYALQKLENNSWTNLVEWNQSDEINTGTAGRNRVGVLAEGPDITLLINDEIVAEVTDNSFASGQIALSAGSYGQPGVEIAFDDFALWRLGEPVTDTPIASPPPLNQLPATDTSVADLVDDIRQRSPDYAEDFSRGDGGWDIFETENILTEHADEALIMLVRTPQRLGSSVYPRPVTDFYMEVDVELLAGPVGTEAGFVFREQDEANYYFYAISHDGYYSLWRKRNNEWGTVIDWTASDTINTGEGAVNTMGLLAQGDRISLFINETLLEEATDNAFSSGTIALTVGTFDEGGAEVAFQGVYIWDLEPGTQGAPPVQRRESEEPEPEPESEPEAQFDAEARLAEILDTPSTFVDDFRRNTGAWEMVDEEGYTFTYRQRALLAQSDLSQWIAWSAYQRNLTDYYFEIDASQINDVEDASYGIIFRLNDDENFLQFGVSIYGTYSVWKATDGEWENLVEWTGDTAINEGVGEVNRLGVLAEGNNIAVVANGIVLATFTEPDLTTGTVGLFIETFEDGGVEGLFDNAELWELSR